MMKCTDILLQVAVLQAFQLLHSESTQSQDSKVNNSPKVENKGAFYPREANANESEERNERIITVHQIGQSNNIMLDRGLHPKSRRIKGTTQAYSQSVPDQVTHYHTWQPVHEQLREAVQPKETKRKIDEDVTQLLPKENIRRTSRKSCQPEEATGNVTFRPLHMNIHERNDSPHKANKAEKNTFKKMHRTNRDKTPESIADRTMNTNAIQLDLKHEHQNDSNRISRLASMYMNARSYPDPRITLSIPHEPIMSYFWDNFEDVDHNESVQSPKLKQDSFVMDQNWNEEQLQRKLRRVHAIGLLLSNQHPHSKPIYRREHNLTKLDDSSLTLETHVKELHNHTQHLLSRNRRQDEAEQRCLCKACDYSQIRNDRLHTVDAIFNKPGLMSSKHKSLAAACGAVNGMRSGVLKEMTNSFPNCIETDIRVKNPLDHWVQYDLSTVYTIDKIRIWRTDNSDYGENLNQNRMKGMSIALDGELCFNFASYNQRHHDTLLRNKILTLDCTRPITGQFIRFYKRKEYSRETAFHLITLCEIALWVCDTGYYGIPDKSCKPCPGKCDYDICDNYYGCSTVVLRNAAIKKPASQSSVQIGNADNAVDGILTYSEAHGCTATDPSQDGQNNRWWRVDMGSTYRIVRVQVTNRHDCCGDKLKTFNVLVSSVVIELARYIPRNLVCVMFNGRVGTGATQKLACTRNLTGRYIAIVTTSPSILQFCEVQAFGYPIREIEPGGDCSILNKAAYCVDGSTCINKECRISFGRVCTKYTSQCVSGTVCDRGFCVFAINEPCAKDKLKCPSGATCDRGSNNRCKWRIGSKCTTSETCQSGSICDSLRQCKLSINADCKSQPTHCQYQTECDAGSNYHCKFSLGESCQNTTFCKSGTACDFFKICKLPIGHSCKASSECIGGAACENSRCTCANSLTSACDPDEGRAGGSCTGQTICVPDSTCLNGKCVCNQGFEISDANFTCKLAVGSTCLSSEGCNTGLVCENSICKRLTGSRCKGPTECRIGNVCDNNICEIAPGSDCSQYPNLCAFDSLCEKGVCRQQLEDPCDPAKDFCTERTMCSKTSSDKEHICRLKPGEDCEGEDETFCANKTLCDEDEVCKLAFGENCDDPYQEECESGTKCDRGKCRLRLGKRCVQNDDCETNAFCDDILSHCRLEVGKPCAGSPPNDMCPPGSFCGPDNTCICSGGGSSILRNSRCEAAEKKITARCDSSKPLKQTCDDTYAQCDKDPKTEQYTCQCMAGSAFERLNFTCGLSPGALCRNTTLNCVTGMICNFNGYCVLEIGQSCEGENRRFCKAGGICEKNTCKGNFKSACTRGSDNMCKSGTVCDALFTCKFPWDASCTSSDVCVAGSHCINDTCLCLENVSIQVEDICEPLNGTVKGKCNSSLCNDPNANCTSEGICECVDGYTVQSLDLSCKISVGGPCSGADTECTTGTACDKIALKCYLQPGQSCSDGHENHCLNGTLCDVNSKECKLDLQGNCSGPYVSHCRYGTFCDWFGTCKYGSSHLCNDTDDCITGANCMLSVCTCLKDESFQIGYICEPKPGYIGSSCDSFTPCKVADSTCVDGMCQCRDNFPLAKGSFQCNSTAQEEYGSKPLDLLLVGLVTASILLLSAIIVAVIRKRGFERKEKYKQQMSNIKQERVQLEDNVYKAIAKELALIESMGIIPVGDEMDARPKLKKKKKESGTTRHQDIYSDEIDSKKGKVTIRTDKQDAVIHEMKNVSSAAKVSESTVWSPSKSSIVKSNPSGLSVTRSGSTKSNPSGLSVISGSARSDASVLSYDPSKTKINVFSMGIFKDFSSKDEAEKSVAKEKH